MPGSAEHLALKADLAWLRFQLGMVRLATLERKYSPDQPRVPAGSPEGGRWTDGGRSSSGDDPWLVLAANRGPAPIGQIQISDPSEGSGAKHVLDTHVAKSNAELLAELRKRDFRGFAFSAYSLEPIGSFASEQDANYYIDDVLAKNPGKIAEVTSGKSPDAFMEVRYPSPTGREIARPDGVLGDMREVFRPTFSAGVAIERAPGARGFRLVTAFPKNQTPDRD